jgi:hypothetical protein
VYISFLPEDVDLRFGTAAAPGRAKPLETSVRWGTVSTLLPDGTCITTDIAPPTPQGGLQKVSSHMVRCGSISSASLEPIKNSRNIRAYILVGKTDTVAKPDTGF